VGNHSFLRSATGSVKGQSLGSGSVDNAEPGQPRLVASSVCGLRVARACVTVPKLARAPSSVRRIGIGCRKVIRCRAWVSDLGRSPLSIAAAGAAGLIIERATSVRFESRLQISVRSIFPAPTQALLQSRPVATGSAGLAALPLTRGAERVGAKGCEGLRANSTASAKGFTRSRDRASIR
jgi:hypothetical protein